MDWINQSVLNFGLAIGAIEVNPIHLSILAIQLLRGIADAYLARI